MNKHSESWGLIAAFAAMTSLPHRMGGEVLFRKELPRSFTGDPKDREAHDRRHSAIIIAKAEAKRERKRLRKEQEQRKHENLQF